MKVVLGVVLAGLVAAGVAAYGVPGKEERLVFVTQPAERGAIVTAVTATGTVLPVVEVTVGSQLSGQIAELHVDYNDTVEKGEPIALIDPQTFEATLRETTAELEIAEARVRIREAALKRAGADVASAEASMAIVEARIDGLRARSEDARRDLERSRALVQRNTISEAQLDDARSLSLVAASDLKAQEAERAGTFARIASAKAAERMAEAELLETESQVKQQKARRDRAAVDVERTVIRSPIDGVVISRNVDQGQTVAASLEAPTLFSIAQNLRVMEVHAIIDEADIGRIRTGQRALFTVDAYPGQVFRGEVVQIRKAPRRIQNVVTYSVLISAANPDSALFPGMTATVSVVVDERQEVLKVPNAALRFEPPTGIAAVEEAGGESYRVWTLSDGGTPVAIPVRVGARDDTASEIVEGAVEPGDPVIVGIGSQGGARRLFGIQFGE